MNATIGFENGESIVFAHSEYAVQKLFEWGFEFVPATGFAYPHFRKNFITVRGLVEIVKKLNK